MTLQFLSEKMCRLLSSLIPGFEGHYEYVPYLISGTTDDLLRREVVCKFAPRQSLPSPYYDDEKPVTAWQVEDVLRNWLKIFPGINPDNFVIPGAIVGNLCIDSDAAYQKIEEYLWTVLGGPEAPFTEKEQSVIAEFGEFEGRKIIAESRDIAEHCKRRGITEHGVNVDGSCNMGCC